MITREADYAIRVVLCLSMDASGEPLSTAEIADTMDLPYRFLRRIVRKLAAARLVGAVRGKDGGIFLLRKPRQISLYEVLMLFDPDAVLFNRCYRPDSCCPRQNYCTVHSRLKLVQDRLDGQLRKLNFAQLAKT